jgi:hypothetical protein
VPGGSAGRRHRPAAPDAPSRPGGNGGSLFTPAYRVNRTGSDAPETRSKNSDGGYLFTAGDAAPGYQPDDDLADPSSAWPAEPSVTAYDWGDDDADPWPGARLPGDQLSKQVASNAVRGFPPEPGELPYVYPPGPFAAWNRGASAADRGRGEGQGGARRGDPARQIGAATITPDEFDTDFSLPAIKDPTPGTARRADSAAGRGASSSGRPGSRATKPAARGPAPRGPRRAAGPGRARPRAGRHSVRVAIVAAAAIIVAVAIVLVLTSHGGSTAGNTAGSRHHPGGKRNSASPTPSAPGGTWRYIAVRATDPVRLTTQELYPRSFTSAGVLYRRSVAAKAAGCRTALIGTSLQNAVHRAGCTQALRASYVSRAAKAMATIGVFNLKTYTGAGTAALAAGHSQFVAQLPANSGPTRFIGQGTGIEYAGVKGHYLVLVYAEFTDLHTPTTSAQRQRLNSFISILIQNTVNVSLSYRMANGKPPSSG